MHDLNRNDAEPAALDEDAIEELAAIQHGLIARHQISGDPFAERLVNSRLRTGRWREVGPGVYSFPAQRSTWMRSLWLEYLAAGPGSLVSHQSAGRLRGWEGMPPGISLIVARDRRHVGQGHRWHRLDDIDPTRDVTVHRGFRVTTTARTIVDLASLLRPERLYSVLEGAIVEGEASVASVGAVLTRVRRRGKPGVRRLCDALDALGPGDAIARSTLEHALDDVIALTGLPLPVHEHPLPSVQSLDGSVDRYFPEALLIVEADGRKWHERRRNMARDRERDLATARTGHQTLRLMWEHLVGDPEGSATTIAEVHAVRLVQLGVADPPVR